MERERGRFKEKDWGRERGNSERTEGEIEEKETGKIGWGRESN